MQTETANANMPHIEEGLNSHSSSDNGRCFIGWSYAEYKAYVDGVAEKIKPYRNNRQPGDNCTFVGLLKSEDNGAVI